MDSASDVKEKKCPRCEGLEEICAACRESLLDCECRIVLGTPSARMATCPTCHGTGTVIDTEGE